MKPLETLLRIGRVGNPVLMGREAALFFCDSRTIPYTPESVLNGFLSFSGGTDFGAGVAGAKGLAGAGADVVLRGRKSGVMKR